MSKTFDDLHKEVSEYMYNEDAGLLRIPIASIIANRMKLGDPIWMLLIGPSSSGKSQILRPLALTDEKFIHRVDDLTENTLLSGLKTKEGEKSTSLLKRIGAMGIIVISDFTVIFSKSPESRMAILGQLRMVYDGEMNKSSGNSSEGIVWKGYLGMLAGSTPSIYMHFEEVADMGERFIYYRMKKYDVEKATRVSLERKLFGSQLDDVLSGIYGDYIKEMILELADDEEIVPHLSKETEERILHIAIFASRLRTPTHYDRFDKNIDKIPVSEAPMRVALQLRAIARGLSVIAHHDRRGRADAGNWELSEDDIGYIEWCAYSLANEERRACLREISRFGWGGLVKTTQVADEIGLSSKVISIQLQHLSAIGLVDRQGGEDSLLWSIRDKNVFDLVCRLEGVDPEEGAVDLGRKVTVEDGLRGESDALWEEMKKG